MNNKQLRLLVLLLSMAAHQNLFAHGSGGGSYDMDTRDLSAEREAGKQAAENKQDQDNWADFMKAIDSPKSETNAESVEAEKEDKTVNSHDHHGDTSH